MTTSSDNLMTSKDLKALIQDARVRNSNNAVDALIRLDEQLFRMSSTFVLHQRRGEYQDRIQNCYGAMMMATVMTLTALIGIVLLVFKVSIPASTIGAICGIGVGLLGAPMFYYAKRQLGPLNYHCKRIERELQRRRNDPTA